MDTVKTCTICERELPATAEFFTRDKTRSDGLHPYCKTCRNAKRTASRQADPEKTRKNRERANAWFYANRERAHKQRKRLYQEHRERAIQESRDWREKNPERYRATQHAYKLKHYRANREQYRTYVRKRRAIKAGAPGTHDASDIADLYEMQAGRCAYCGVSLSDGYHVDHVVPLSRGGANSPDNLALACVFCNCSKSGQLLEEWHPIS